MIQTGFETRVKVQQIIENQLPEFILDESPNAAEFLKQYYISQEYQGGPVDIAENLDQYLKLDNLTPEVIVGSTSLSNSIDSTSGIVTVTSTKGFPQKYGLFKVDDEIISYTGITTNTFTGCIRGFSGITTYHTITDPQELEFSTSNAAEHSKGAPVQNLSSLFLKEFYKKLKYSLTPGLEDIDFDSNLNVGNFIKEARSFYQAKGTDESFRILFNVLYGVTPKVVNLEDLIIKPSSADYVRREVSVAEVISGDPTKLVGQSIRKSSDTNTYASVSEVEPFTKDNKTYYQISLFIGYDESTDIQGTFSIQGKSLVVEKVSIGSSVITVDSTIGFPKNGNLVSGNNNITYTNKSINQFFGCSGVKNEISIEDSIRTDEVVYGYENGDLSKKVELRFTGVISQFVPLSEVFITEENEAFYVKNLGEIIKNPSTNKTRKEIFSNSWIYNTSSRYQIDSVSGSSFKLLSLIDKSSLKVNDNVEILIRDTHTVVSSTTNIPYVSNINQTTNQIDLANLSGFTYNPNLKYDVRKKLTKSTSSGAPLQFGNNVLTSNIQNVYNENDEYMYVASNSLPAYTITKNLFEISISAATPPRIQGFDSLTQKYSIISFASNAPFITGDEIYYSTESSAIPGLTKGVYYVEVITPNQIRLYVSRSFIGSSYDALSTSRPFVQFDSSNSGPHYFTLNSQKNRSISPSKLFKKFPLSPNLANGLGELTQPGSVGMLVNGVEITNYKSNDKIYYGPLDSIRVLNGGSGYDVINLPEISITSDTGNNALVQPVIKGSLEKVFVDPQDFDINSIVSIALTGGNGSGASFEPVIVKRVRELSFDGRETTNSGGIDITNETITFTANHNLTNGETIIYDANGNLPIGIGTFKGSNSNPGVTLSDKSSYYCSVVNSKTIQLYQNVSDFNLGINTVGFTTTNTTGIHKFRTEYNKSTLKEIKVINPGSGYENRKLIVKPAGISTAFDTVIFTNHGFKDGDLIVYNYQNQIISGLSTSIQYKVLRVDADSFRLCNAGSAGTITSFYERQDYVKFQSIGSGYQYFSYPPILLSVNYTAVGLGTTTQTVGVITATPIIRGEIIDAYLYEKGTDYGSTILNLHKKPIITINNGKNAQISPIIVDGSIQNVFVQYGGLEYYSTPDLIVSGEGTGASLRPIIVNGKIDSVIVVNPGVGYAQSTTSISVVPAGNNAIFDSNVRSLTVNTNKKYGDEVIFGLGDNLEYSVSAYAPVARASFNDPDPVTKHSPIIGWAYDGNPIYGPYGYANPQDTSSIRVLKSGYQLNTSTITNRPSGFAAGFFVEDYVYTNSGDLDENNGRFGKTKDFPNGVYAYFATVDSTNVGITSFPYFIGNSYRSNYIKDNLYLDQSFDFNNSDLIRNTLPYKVNDPYAGNDFIIESNELVQQKSIIESVTKAPIESFDIINSGYNYRVNDILEFDNTGTNGGGINAIVSSVIGSGISSINTTIDTYQNSIFTWKDGNTLEVSIKPSHSLSNGDNVIISGLTSSLSQINKLVQIGISSYRSSVAVNIPSNSIVGLVTDIYVSQIPDKVSAGSSISIESEVLSVLNVFPYENIIRVRRGVGAAHTTTTTIQFIPETFTFNAKTDYFESKVNDKVFFNPSESIGLGRSVGVSTARVFALGISTVGVATYVRNILTQSIYIENHPFSNNQQVILRIPNASYPISISTSFSGTVRNIPSSGTSQTVYVTNKSKNTIGIKTTLSSSEVFFVGIGSDSYEYSLESNFSQVSAKVEKIKSTISVSTAHELNDGDLITLKINPNQSVGVGTSGSIYVRYNSSKQKLLINPIGFSSSGINTLTSTITLNNHNLSTGDKVFYSSTDRIASGLSTGSYFVYKIDSDSIKLASTYIDSKNDPPTVVSIASSGGRFQSISPINPEIKVARNNNLVFNLSDSSLSGYKFKLFYDSDFNDEFISTGSTITFSTIGVGTAGISTNASLTLNYSEDLPSTLFYTLEKTGYISTSDRDVSNYSKISFIDSLYNGTYPVSVSGLGSTSFSISLKQIPEKSSYTPSDCDVIEYSTTSLTAKGGISKIKKLSGGNNYKKFPVFTGVASSEGTGAYVIAKSNNIGKVKEVRILNPGFEYGSDKTLRPTAYISPIVTIRSSYDISAVSIIDGGKNYNFAPNLTVINSITRQNINNGSLEAILSNNSITSVKVIEPPTGIPSDDVEIIATNNSNGNSVDKVYASGIGIVTCYLTTPVLGFSTSPFNVGDRIYVEGIKNATSGIGYNSENYGYIFFTVSKFENTIPAKLEYSISGLTTSNPGVAQTAQNSIPTIIKSTDYPQFSVTKLYSSFKVGEKISTYDGSKFVERDLIITSYNRSNIRVSGSYEISVDEVIKGTKSGATASIDKIEYNSGRFETDYALRRDFGWSNDTGKLNEDYQVIEDNDYYQNLSYTVKSPIDYETLVSPVNRLLHTSGLKNFADTGISSITNSGIKTSIDGSIQIVNFVDENRIDTINNFDLCSDIEASTDRAKYVKFQNKKLSDYIECISNRVLLIDDISSRFSKTGFEGSDQSNLINILPSDGYNRYLIQITDVEKTQYQINELVILNDQNNLYTLQKGSINNLGLGTYRDLEKIADVSGYTDITSNRQYLRFEPVDVYNKDYNIKVLNNKFVNDISGIGTQNLGLINLISSNISIPTGITSSVISVASTTYNSLYFNIHVRDNSTSKSNYAEIYLDHNGTDTFISQYYFDSNSESGVSYGMIGSFGATLSGGILSLNFTNTSTNQVTVRSKIVGFGSTASGISTYRYKLPDQIDETELTAIYESNYSRKSGISTITTLSKTSFATVKSIVRVSVGNTSALHQVLLVNDGNNLGVKQYPFLSVGSTSGIGTFGGVYSGSNFALRFYPDANITGIINISSLNEEIYTDYDSLNIPQDLEYGQITESLSVFEYGGINGNRISRTSFDLNYNGYPIFKKTFNPKDTSTLDPQTGIFTIKNHFLNTGEELIYTPKSTFIGVGQSSVGIGLTADYAGIVTNRLPSKVYPIKITNDTFRLSTRKEYANAGIYVTFTSYGLGNAHELEMTKKLEKSIIVIDGLVQYPISYTNLNYSLFRNGGQIGASSSIFSVSGISSVNPSDIIRIDDEYMQVINVGFGTTNVGPITGVGTTALVQVSRGFVGSSASTHTDSSSVKIYRGSYNIVGNKIYFTDPPTGDLRAFRDSSNLIPPRSSFDGRVYLRKDYTTNQLYDNISEQFTGIGKTYTLTVNGINTVGLGTSGGNGILFINSIFQKPSTVNNSGNNFSIVENAGATNVVFSGISTSAGSPTIISNDDVNKNQLPRGGLIVSLGSTGGLGYAPLVGASVTAVVSGGSIVSVGIGTTDIIGSGYYGPVSIAVTDTTGINASITARVGAGGTLSFTVVNGGSGYTNPKILIPSPSYENLSFIGVSRLGIGTTTQTGVGLLVNIEVGASSTTGIGSTLFEVTSFKIQRSGYGFKPGDVITPVGLVTARGLSSPISQFRLNVLDTFTDSFASWQFGELDYIDSIEDLQDGVRVTFPLYYNSSLLSFEINKNDQDSSQIDLNNVLLIFINGVLQKPGDSYTFGGGSVFTFSNPPKAEDEIAIFFYRGSRNSDSILVPGQYESIKSGDIIQLRKNNAIPSTVNQDLRTVFTILGSDKLETNLYTKQGIDNVNFRPLSLIKQKVDANINGQITYKSRDSIESEVYPTAKIIGNLSTTDNQIFVDDAYFFNYEENQSATVIDSVGGLIVSGTPDTVSAGVTALVSSSRQIQYLSIGSSGSYYSTPNITNIHLRSEDFSTGWTVTSATLTANAAIAPDGLLSAGSFICNSTTNTTRRLYASANITTVSGVEYTYTVYLKSSNSWRYVYISLSSGTTTTESGGARFDIINGTVNAISSGSASIINAGNGWWRVSVTTTGNSITGMRPKVILVDSTGTAGSSAVGVVGSGLFVWGAQLEEKITYSAYIPTAATSRSGSSIQISISAPSSVGVGLGTTATAIGSIVSGTLTKALLTNPGFGYTTSSPPRVLVFEPSPTYEKISGINNVQGFSGIITGIQTTTGTLGNTLAIRFHLNVQSPTSFPSGLTTGYPIYIYNTSVGRGVTSIDGNNTATVGIGTTFLDNVYKIHSFTYTSLTNASIVCNVLSTTSIVGIATSGTASVGRFSWGRMSGFSRSSSPISIGVTGNIIDVGLSTFPTIQRRGYGLRDTGSLKKDLG